MSTPPVERKELNESKVTQFNDLVYMFINNGGCHSQDACDQAMRTLRIQHETINKNIDYFYS